MTRGIIFALVLCGAGVGIGFGVLGQRSEAPRKNPALEEEMKRQVVRCWKTAREGCRDKCMAVHGPEMDATLREHAAKADAGEGDFFAAIKAGHELGTKAQACIDTCARVEVESRGVECQPL